MPEKITITNLVHEAVAAAARPLDLDAIAAFVKSYHPRPPKNPKQSARSVLSQSPVLVPLHDGSYAYLPNYFRSCSFRFTILPPTLEHRQIFLDELARVVLWPALYAAGNRRDDSPLRVSLADGPDVSLNPVPSMFGNDIAEAPPEFWNWLESYYPQAGDDVIIRASPEELPNYTLEFAPQSGRDEERLDLRNKALADLVYEYLQRRGTAAPTFELTQALIVLGAYKDPEPPESIQLVLPHDERFVALDWGEYCLVEHMTPDKWRRAALHEDASEALFNRLGGDPDRAVELLNRLSSGDPDATYAALEEAGLSDILAQALGMSDPESALAAALFGNEFGESEDPPFQLEKKSDRAKWKKDVYTLKVRLKWAKGVWRHVEIRGDQTLHDLHYAILDAYDWDEEHLYSFFLSNKAWDMATEIASPFAQEGWDAEKVRMGALQMQVKDKFLFIFDYGDEHRFEITLTGIAPAEKGVKYPRVVKEVGTSPPQYPEWE